MSDVIASSYRVHHHVNSPTSRAQQGCPCLCKHLLLRQQHCSRAIYAGGAPAYHVLLQAAVLAFLAVYVPLSGWRMERRLGLYLVGLYILSQVPPPFSTSCPMP